MNEMFPRPTDYLQPQKQSAWIEKAKMTIQGEKKVEPFNFQPEVRALTALTSVMCLMRCCAVVLRQAQQHRGGKTVAGQDVHAD